MPLFATTKQPNFWQSGRFASGVNEIASFPNRHKDGQASIPPKSGRTHSYPSSVRARVNILRSIMQWLNRIDTRQQTRIGTGQQAKIALASCPDATRGEDGGISQFSQPRKRAHPSGRHHDCMPKWRQEGVKIEGVCIRIL
jgi:hypothetical protein